MKDACPPEPLFRRSIQHALSISPADQTGSQFSVVSYNILADVHIPKPEDDICYPFCLSEFKYKTGGKDSHRHKLLVKEVCLLLKLAK